MLYGDTLKILIIKHRNTDWLVSQLSLFQQSLKILNSYTTECGLIRALIERLSKINEERNQLNTQALSDQLVGV